MLYNHIGDIIKKHFPHQPTKPQSLFVTKVSEYLGVSNSSQIFILKGFAGTGKTTTVAALVKGLKELKVQTVLLAPTGRAAKVLGSYAKKNAFTIHKEIYRQQSDSEGQGKFVLNFNKHSDTVFIVDEASMISNESTANTSFGTGRLLDDLIEFIFADNRRNKLILVGDTAQLPPIGLPLSHALDKEYLEQHYYMDVHESFLDEVVRQAQDSGILYNATAIRNLLDNENSDSLALYTAQFSNIAHINGGELVETIENAYSKYGTDNTIVITRSNKRANKFNEGIRRMILHKEEEVSRGDYLMIVKNNYFWHGKEKKNAFIANGEIAEVVKFKKQEDLYGFRFADIRIRLVDYDDLELDVKIVLDTLTIEAPSLSYEANRQLYFAVSEDYQHIKSKAKRWKAMQEDPYFNALQVKFSYAITCHKSQGGQWDCIFLDQGYLAEEMLDTSYYRWLYTAFTRASKQLYLVNFDPQYHAD